MFTRTKIRKLPRPKKCITSIIIECPTSVSLYLNTLITFNPKAEPYAMIKALLDLDWKQAMQAEYDALISNNTWTLVPQFESMYTVRCKWVFKVKYNSNKFIQMYKARMVAKELSTNL